MEDLLEGFELHSPEKIRAAIAAGADAKRLSAVSGPSNG